MGEFLDLQCLATYELQLRRYSISLGRNLYRLSRGHLHCPWDFLKSRLVSIEFTLSSEKTLELNVFNASGRKVTSLEKHFQSGLNTVEIELPSKGIYFMNIDNKTIKIVVAD